MLKLGIIFAALAVCHVQGAYQYLFTLANQAVPVNVSNTEDAYLPNLFNPEDNTIVLIHGQGGGVGHEFNTLIMREIFQFHGPNNIIVFDWEREASGSYSDAVANVPYVASELSNFLIWLSDAAQERPDPRGPLVDVKQVHLVGFDLGAHIAGIASRQLRLSHGVVGRITGLDPSGRRWGSNSQRLRNTDAHYVEVLHTDGLGPTANGIGTRLGHIDFYANGGNSQPGCFTHSCNHNRAYELFAASMRGHLLGRPCDSLTQMNFGRCRGPTLDLGGIILSKPSYNTIYTVSTESRFPF